MTPEPMWLIERRRDTGFWRYLPWFLRPYDYVTTVFGDEAFKKWCQENSWVGIRTEYFD